MTGESSAGRGGRTARRRGTWIRIGRLGGVGLFLDPLLPLLVLLLAATRPLGEGLTRAGIAFLLLILFVLLHEAGHAWMARRRGLAVRGIYLHLLPVTYVEQGTPADEWRVALAGPVANLLLGGLLLAVHLLLGRDVVFSWDGLTADLLLLAMAVNLGMAALNLVPLLPTDGGRIVRALVTQRRSPAAARVVAFWLGLVGGLALVGAALLWTSWPQTLWVALLGVYVIYVARREGSPTAR